MCRSFFFSFFVASSLLVAAIAAAHPLPPGDSHAGSHGVDTPSDGGHPFNPTMSFLGDFVVSWGDGAGPDAGADGFKLRGAELGLFGEVEDGYEFTGIIFFDEEQIELEEAFMVANDWISPDVSIKAGRFNLDFGQFSAIHDGELATLDKPSVLQEYIGGTLRGTGAELHWEHLSGATTMLEGTVGICQQVDSDFHGILGPVGGHHEHEELDSGVAPSREFEDFAMNARISAHLDVGSGKELEVGTSYLHAPSRVFGVGEDDIHSVDHAVHGVDVTFTSDDDSSEGGYLLQGEFLFNSKDFGDLDDGGTPADPLDDQFLVTRQEASGFTLLLEKRIDHESSFGVSCNLYEHAEDSAEESRDFGIYFTRHLNQNNRLRFEIRTFEDLLLEDEGVEELVDFTAYSIQWTIMLGSHGHPDQHPGEPFHR